MLFFNFLCLFYLMVLINSHTISKSIANDNTVDDIVDSIHDLEYRREYKPRHDRLHRHYRKEEKEKQDAPKPKDKEGENTKSTAAKLVSDTTEVTKLETRKPILKSTKHLGFWQKLKSRNEKKCKGLKDNEIHKRKAMPRRRSYHSKQYLLSRNDRDSEYVDAAAFRQIKHKNRYTIVGKRKRDVVSYVTPKSSISTRASTVNPFSSKSSSFLKLNSIKFYETTHSNDNLTKALTEISTKVDDLKKEYAFRMKNSSYPSFATTSMTKVMSTPSLSPETTGKPTTEDVDFLGTAQIEALLNDIKIKAVQMVAEQSPAITDIITNTVTETTFEADPILTHISSPGYALSTFISIDSDSTFSKRTVSPGTVNEIIIANTEPTHRVTVRSINEDMFTIAQTIEDMLQRELKKVYKKVKENVPAKWHKGAEHLKTTVAKGTGKIAKKITQEKKKQSLTSVTTPMPTPKTKMKLNSKQDKSQLRRTPKRGKNDKNNIKTSQETTQSTFDDYAMLTLYENILTKTHENNVMKMLSTQNEAPMNQEGLRLFKRAPATVTVSLKRDDQKVYDEVILPDEFLDFGTKATNPYSSSTEADAEDTSYEGLSNKISYNDYVNGYKHYLKFQKEQGSQNFSNLIRYQAHRHHSVDDIGKFILNKIPQLPTNNREKRFFDDDTMDDQDMSTKSDDSWFKKHFYFFIDNGPPKKYHTSQTVELKSPILTDPDVTTSGTGSPGITQRLKNKGLTENVENPAENNKAGADSIEDSLEQLSKALDERKNKEFTSVMPARTNDGDKMEEHQNRENNADNSIFRGLGSIGLVDKLFRGKGRRTSKHSVKVYNENDEEDTDIEREKRSTPTNANDHMYTEMHRVKPTVPNVIETRNKNYGYVDVKLIPRPTAIVKLRENTQKTGKLKKLLNKLRFRKRKKGKTTTKTLRAKRDYRVQRFNPFKKLKEMFNAKQLEKPSHTLEMPDYEMMTSRIDTFKPVKYNKVMSVEEIKGQIPNITEDLSQFHQGGSVKSMDKAMQPFSFEIPNLNPNPEVYDSSHLVDVKTPNAEELTESSRSPKKHQKHKKIKNLGKPFQDLNFDMPEMTYDPSTNKFVTNYGTTPSLEDIKSEINSLQSKLSMSDSKPTMKTPAHYRLSPGLIATVSPKKIYLPPHLTSVQTLPNTSAKADPKDIKIQTKLTRIAKFPLCHLSHDHYVKINSVIEKPPAYELASVKKGPHDKIVLAVRPEKRIRKKSLNNYYNYSYRPSISFNDFTKEETFSKPFPDYFNDLLMWHGDLLNADKLTTPLWEDILKGVNHNAEVSTLSMADMQRELIQIRDYLKIDESLRKHDLKVANQQLKSKLALKTKKDKTRSNSKKAQNIIKTVAFKDDTIAKGDDVIIEGESKYFHLEKQPEPDSQYLKAADLLKDLNKIYFKSPAIKYDIESKIHDGKRNGDFGINDLDPKDKNDKDQDSLLFLDTTLLAYDDGPDFLTDRPKHKKMSKNLPGSSKARPNVGSPKPVATTNKSPAQYFSTPLPMRMNDFERFLKDNQLDVQSVTTPLVGMPRFVIDRTPTKIQPDKKDPQTNSAKLLPKKVTLVAPSSFVTINPLNFYFNTKNKTNENNRLTIKDVYANSNENSDDMRHKRYSEIRNERFFTFEPFKKLSGKAKKKIKLFDKKTYATTTPAYMSNVHYTVIGPAEDDGENKQVELTIINMNDIDQSVESKDPTEYTTTDKPKRVSTRAGKTTEKTLANTEKTSAKAKTTKSEERREGIDEIIYPLHQKMHSNLLFDRKDKTESHEKVTKTLTLPQSTFNFDNFVGEDDYTTTFQPMINDKLYQKSFHPKQPPKRVKISSHSYKYDIIYQDPNRQRKNSKSKVKYSGWLHPVPNDHLQSPYNSDLTQTIRTFDRKNEIIKIVRAVEAVESYTRPSVIIHIDLPTYYMPYTGPTEKTLIPYRQKSMWNDFVLKYLSGIALIELLNKFGILKAFDGKINFTDGVDNAVNASKVFSSAEDTGFEKELNWRTKTRISRQVTDLQLENSDKFYTMAPNWREKRRLKLFSNIKDKLKTLLRKNTNISTTVKHKNRTNTKEDEDATPSKSSAAVDHKPKREKSDESNGEEFKMNDDSINVDYAFDIDRIVERATSDTAKAKKVKSKTKDKNKKQKVENEFSDADIPYLSPTTTQGMSSKKYNITSAMFPDLIPQISTDTATASTTTMKNDPLSTIATPTTAKEKAKHGSKEEVYFEPLIYDNKIYYEPGTQTRKPTVKEQTVKHKEDQTSQTKSVETKLEKRDIQPAGKFTAKNVAALEVIVDLVKNAINSFEEQEGAQDFTESSYQNHPSMTSTLAESKLTAGTNSIQVHIAIPCNLQVDKKRSFDSFKVKRVFEAKMFSPVDLEYQIQTFDDKPTSTASAERGDFTPKMYLLIDTNGTLTKSYYPIKPYKGDIDFSKVQVRQVTTTKAFSTEKSQTSSVKNIGRVTLSKDFVAAINKHLVQLYENLTALNESTPSHHIQVRETDVSKSPKNEKDTAKSGLRRHLNWEAVKKYFGHDRVCNCKCKPNRTMCRACAATDAVISELIFEFENLAKYMDEHCTEIQTFFWMNPSGGKKLRDTVHKVDQTLHAYFKRVKGKCQGRTCKTFSTCIDKRSFVKKKKMPKKYIGYYLIADLENLATDIETASDMEMCFKDNFMREGEALVKSLGNCFRDVNLHEKSKLTSNSNSNTVKTTKQTDTTTTKKMIKHVYSLDNINVNIICKPDSKETIASSTPKMFSYDINTGYVPTDLNLLNSNFDDYEMDIQPKKKRKGLRHLFGNGRIINYKNIFTYYTTKDEFTTHRRTFRKRQTANQIESPLISDSSGTFWKDYLKDIPYPKEHLVRNNEDTQTSDRTNLNSNEKDTITSTTIRDKRFDAKSFTSELEDRILSTTSNPYLAKHVFQRDVNTTDYASIDTLSHNINELFKIFHNLTDLKEIEDMSTQTFELTEKHTKTKPKHSSKQPAKTTKIFKNLKEKFHHKHKSNATKSSTKHTKKTPKTPPTLDTKENSDIGSSNTSDITIPLKPTTKNISAASETTTLKSSTSRSNTMTSSKPEKMKFTINHKETSSQGSSKVKNTSQSEPTKPETSSSTEPGEGIQIKFDNPPKVIEKPFKPNFLNKLKLATLDFFHNKAKELKKTTASIDNTEEVRKSRASSEESNYITQFDDSIENNQQTNKLDEATNVISEPTSEANPTILIINEYDSETENDLTPPDNYTIEDVDKEANYNFRNLLLSILNYEAQKLDNEWRRIKKDGRKIITVTENRNTEYAGVTQDVKRDIFGLYLSTGGSNIKGSPNVEIDYDILKTLKDLELPTPKGMEAEKKGDGFLQKIANKFGVKVVPNTNTASEKPKATRTESPHSHQTEKETRPPQPTARRRQNTTGRRQNTKLTSHKGETPKEDNSKAKTNTTKLNPKYTQMPLVEPKVMVRINSNNQEASKSAQVCDVDATFKQIHKLIQKLPKKDFEQYISNKTCDKYKNLPNYFVIDITRKTRKQVKKFRNTKRRPKWDWIRSKRSLNHGRSTEEDIRYDTVEIKPNVVKKNTRLKEIKKVFDDIQRLLEKKPDTLHRLHKTSNVFNVEKPTYRYDINKKTDKDIDDTNGNKITDSASFVVEGNDYFEALEKDRHGIYRSRSKKRRKRANNIAKLESGMKNLPYSSKPNESYVMRGDTVVIQCMTKKPNATDRTEDTKDFKWSTDRRDMLLYDNVVVDGPKLMITEVDARNLGDYTCQKGKTAQRKIRLTIITLPTFHVIFTPFYKVDGQCTYEDLRAVQHLGSLMTREVCSDDQLCSVTVEEPVCLRDKLTNTPYLRLTATLSVHQTAGLVCGARCRRDAHAALAMLAAESAPALAGVKVIIRNDYTNKTLVPMTLSGNRRTIITHTLRRKDAINHRDYYSHTFSSERVNLIAACPAGYYLIEEQKICAACPFGSWSNAGKNSCAANSSSSDGISARLRRCYWYPGWGWCAAGWGVACACAALAALLHSRGAKGAVMNVKGERAHTPRARPLSPSRVILAKFFRGSRSSTKATDSQETKFGLWKEKHQPPPLPPIDFD